MSGTAFHPSTLSPPPIADAGKRLHTLCRRLYETRATLSPDVWCERYRRLPGASETGLGSARPGRMDLGLTPYVRQMLRDWADPRVREIFAQKSAQTGLSEALGITALLWSLVEKRRPVKVIYPTEAATYNFNNKRLIPALRACEPAAALITRPRQVKTLELNVGGAIATFGWSNSSSTQKSDPIPDIVLDEIDEYDYLPGVLANCRDRQKTFDDSTLLGFSTPEKDLPESEKDPARGVAGLVERCRHRFTLFVPCPFTGRFFAIDDFGLLRWHGGKTADPAVAESTAYLISPFVDADPELRNRSPALRIREAHKRWMLSHAVWLRQGEYIESDGRILETRPNEQGQGHHGTDAADRADQAEPLRGQSRGLSEINADLLREPPARPDRHTRQLLRETEEQQAQSAELIAQLGVRIVGGDEGAAGRIPPAATRGYRLSAMASLLQTWGSIARDFVAAKGHPGPGWIKGTLGKVPEAPGDRHRWSDLKRLCKGPARGGHAIGTVPRGRELLYAAVDVQLDCIYVSVLGFGALHDNPALVDAFRLSRQEGEQLRDVEQAIDSLACPMAEDPEREIPVLGVAIDSGHWTEDVYALVRRLNSRRRGDWAVAIKGQPGDARPYRDVVISEKRLPDGTIVPREEHQRLVHIGIEHYKTMRHTLLIPPPAEQGAGSASAASLQRSAEHGGQTASGDLFSAASFAGPADGPIAAAAMAASQRRLDLPAIEASGSDGGGGSAWHRLEAYGRLATQIISRDGEEWLRQVSCERRIKQISQGRTVLRWRKSSENAADHYGDTVVYALARAAMGGVEKVTAQDVQRIRDQMGRRRHAAPAGQLTTGPLPAPKDKDRRTEQDPRDAEVGHSAKQYPESDQAPPAPPPTAGPAASPTLETVTPKAMTNAQATPKPAKRKSYRRRFGFGGR